MSVWLIDTLVWTAALIAAVLVLRRPVARIFGPNVAYALWAIPLLRLVLPPITLPAWLAAAVETPADAGLTIIITTRQAMEAAPTTPAAGFDWTLLASGIWLAGITVFLIARFSAYFRMRRELLENAHPVGESGQVRIVETPGTNSPIAFGIIDKVIALPEGFMALTDRTERDLALEHELAHHKAGDLIANFAVQPLFAFHWFNPLGWYGWRAMRRDQEAACDARVMSARGQADRATYAAIIANYAAGPNIALAAPMACPVIGEKSIIHRLRSLTMKDITPRRRVAGRLMMGAALLALPLTASITYAESISAPAAPAAPSAPGALAPLAPPAPPVPPVPPLGLSLQAASDAPNMSDGDADVYVFETETTDENGDATKSRVERRHKVIFAGDGEKMSAEEREEMMKELREQLADVDVEVRKAMEEVRVAVIEMKGEDGNTKIEMECTDDKESGEWKTDDGKRIIRICKSEIMASALTGLKAAREAIADNPEMAPDMRAEVLKALDQKIGNWGKEG
ncbi:hypothetical protein GCM10023115_15750 [Pontixanthobacter gangjinensis]|uniref:Peptidase M56 domain-containing protein n=1 Tax=Pontixanthobacter gangjinensis TaxID=1028742 RepID=A0A6I4SN68_9SPHN|nr:M56 family metallopeptidase [Pontixanthobacter gangjinensis]MXO56818.1 hypothetical protein [Pontixanthobacter gangjinensis]